MISAANSPGGVSRTTSNSVPFAAAWIDRLIAWISGLPIPAWLLYPVPLGLIFLVINVGRWLDGTAPIGSLDAPYAFAAFYPVYCLAAIHYLEWTAGRAFDFFRPALGGSEAEAARLRYELTRIPARPARAAAAVGFGFFVLLFVESDLRNSLHLGLYYAALCAVVACGLVMTAQLFYQALRQLRLVSRIHASAQNVDLFHFAPLYSFSALTARTGLIFAILLWFDLAVNPETLINGPLLALNAVQLVLCAACFVLPLQGMHQRILTVKRNLELEVNQRVTAIVEHLYGQVDGLNLTDADAVNKTLNSLVATRDLIEKIPAWPWRPETFAVFFSALTLPVIVFLIQMSLKTLLGFK